MKIVAKNPFSFYYLLFIFNFIIHLNINGQDYSLGNRNNDYSNYYTFSKKDFLDKEAIFIQEDTFILANFKEGSFKKGTRFKLSVFKAPTVFQGASFDSLANFDSVSFIDKADFSFTSFKSGATFSGSTFNQSTNFKNVQFDTGITFVGSTFNDVTDFSYTNFINGASFENVIFHSKVRFTNAAYDKFVNFNNAKFRSTVSFENFNNLSKSTPNSWKFTGSEFNNEVDFDNATLPDTLYFNNVKIKGIIDLTKTRLNNKEKRKTKILLVGTDISKLKLNYELFELFFLSEVSYEQKISTYERLLKGFKDEGFEESYKNLDIEYQNFKFKQNKNYFINTFQQYWWNYGYNKEWVIYSSICLLGIFSLINIFLYSILQEKVYKIDYKFYDEEDYIRQLDLFKTKITNIIGYYPSQSNVLSTIWTFLYLTITSNWTNVFKLTFHLAFAYISLIWNYFLLKVINSILYTSFIFFGLRISLDHFAKFTGLTLYVWLIYVIGLFCLAYILNIIIVK